MSKQLMTAADFGKSVEKRASTFRDLLPANVDVGRFVASAKAAALQNPQILRCDPVSLIQALSRAAQDGLMPDGREGALVSFRQKAQGGGYVETATWMPMIQGLRKRAKELDGLTVSAEVVHERDEFLVALGDEPRLEHAPPRDNPFGDRGAIVGAYAIIRAAGGAILHREIMARAEIDAVRAKSRAKDGMMWKEFFGEAARKTVARRALKTCPVSAPLDTILRRGDEASTIGEEAPLIMDAQPRTERVSAAPVLEPLPEEAPVLEPEEEAVAEPPAGGWEINPLTFKLEWKGAAGEPDATQAALGSFLREFFGNADRVWSKWNTGQARQVYAANQGMIHALIEQKPDFADLDDLIDNATGG